MKRVSQLDENGYFVGVAVADESPMEPGIFHLPAGAVDIAPPAIEDGKRYKPNGKGWTAEEIPKPEPEPEPPAPVLTYRELRAREYPPIGDQLDALYHAGIFPAEMAAQIRAVKDKYPKTTEANPVESAEGGTASAPA